MAVYAIGDIHGCYKQLVRLIELIPKSKKDTFVFLGDYVDKGKKSKDVIDYLIDLSKKYTCVFLRGNHELLMMNACSGKQKFSLWHSRGGKRTLKSYGIKKKKNWVEQIDKSHWEFIEKTLPCFEYKDFIFVHAGLKKGVPLQEQSELDLIWRKYFSPEKYEKGKIVICGHTVRKSGKIANYGHTICIDTNAYGGKFLSCLNVKTGEFFQVKRKSKVRKGILIMDKKEPKLMKKSG